ncbi:MAG: DUF6799 domain-containing protein [Bacteroidales bacterium]
MKKLMLVFAAIAITAGAYAQADSANRKMSPKDVNKHQNQTEQNNSYQNRDAYQNDQNNPNPDGVMMENGKMMQVKNGEKTILQDNDLAMNNGTKIMSDGNYIKKDGTKTMMKEGQRMDMSGNMISTKTNNDKNLYLVPDSTRKENK